MKFSTLAAAAMSLVFSLGFSTAHAVTVVDLDATKGTGVPGSQIDSARKSVTLAAGSYSLSVIDNTADGGYAGWMYNTGSSNREAFDFSLDGGKNTFSVDVGSSNGKFNSYATTADALAAFATGPYTIYGQVGGAYDGVKLVSNIGKLDFTLAAPTTILFGIPDNRFADNSHGVSLAITAAVPEPETYALMLAGLGAVGFIARRRKGV